MTVDRDPKAVLGDQIIPGQMDVYDCLEEAERDGHGHAPEPEKPRPLTAAEVVARRLRDQEDR